MTKFSLSILFRFLWQMYARWTYALPTQPLFFYLEIQAALLASFRGLTDAATLKLIMNLGKYVSFAPRLLFVFSNTDDVCILPSLPVSRLK